MEYVPLHSLRVQLYYAFYSIALFVLLIRIFSLFWYYMKQIMNVYSACNGKNIFIRWKMECSIQRGDSRVEWNIPSFTEWKYSYHCTNKHSLFVYHILKVVDSTLAIVETTWSFSIILKPGFYMVVTVVKIDNDLSQQPKYNSLELKIGRAIINREYIWFICDLQVKTIIIWPFMRKIVTLSLQPLRQYGNLTYKALVTQIPDSLVTTLN
jgi:hypothetical protein